MLTSGVPKLLCVVSVCRRPSEGWAVSPELQRKETDRPYKVMHALSLA